MRRVAQVHHPFDFFGRAGHHFDAEYVERAAGCAVLADEADEGHGNHQQVQGGVSEFDDGRAERAAGRVNGRPNHAQHNQHGQNGANRFVVAHQAEIIFVDVPHDGGEQHEGEGGGHEPVQQAGNGAVILRSVLHKCSLMVMCWIQAAHYKGNFARRRAVWLFLHEKTVLLFRKTRRAINKRLANFQALAIMSHFNGGSPCMVIFSNGSGTGVSSPLEKVSAKGSARLLIQSRCFGSGVFICAGCFRMGKSSLHFINLFVFATILRF